MLGDADRRPSDRFDYKYAELELEHIASEVKQIAQAVAEVRVIFNYKYGDQGVRNGRTMMGSSAKFVPVNGQVKSFDAMGGFDERYFAGPQSLSTSGKAAARHRTWRPL